MPVFLASILIEYAWPLSFAIVGTYAAAVARDWLRQRAVDITKHVDERDTEWSKEFEELKRELIARVAHVERNISAAQPDFKPMGKHYNPRA
jgi:hypothetical protein